MTFIAKYKQAMHDAFCLKSPGLSDLMANPVVQQLLVDADIRAAIIRECHVTYADVLWQIMPQDARNDVFFEILRRAIRQYEHEMVDWVLGKITLTTRKIHIVMHAVVGNCDLKAFRILARHGLPVCHDRCVDYAVIMDSHDILAYQFQLEPRLRQDFRFLAKAAENDSRCVLHFLVEVYTQDKSWSQVKRYVTQHENQALADGFMAWITKCLERDDVAMIIYAVSTLQLDSQLKLLLQSNALSELVAAIDPEGIWILATLMRNPKLLLRLETMNQRIHITSRIAHKAVAIDYLEMAHFITSNGWSWSNIESYYQTAVKHTALRVAQYLTTVTHAYDVLDQLALEAAFLRDFATVRFMIEAGAKIHTLHPAILHRAQEAQQTGMIRYLGTKSNTHHPTNAPLPVSKKPAPCLVKVYFVESIHIQGMTNIREYYTFYPELLHHIPAIQAAATVGNIELLTAMMLSHHDMADFTSIVTTTAYKHNQYAVLKFLQKAEVDIYKQIRDAGHMAIRMADNGLFQEVLTKTVFATDVVAFLEKAIKYQNRHMIDMLLLHVPHDELTYHMLDLAIQRHDTTTLWRILPLFPPEARAYLVAARYAIDYDFDIFCQLTQQTVWSDNDLVMLLNISLNRNSPKVYQYLRGLGVAISSVTGACLQYLAARSDTLALMRILAAEGVYAAYDLRIVMPSIYRNDDVEKFMLLVKTHAEFQPEFACMYGAEQIIRHVLQSGIATGADFNPYAIYLAQQGNFELVYQLIRQGLTAHRDDKGFVIWALQYAEAALDRENAGDTDYQRLMQLGANCDFDLGAEYAIDAAICQNFLRARTLCMPQGLMHLAAESYATAMSTKKYHMPTPELVPGEVIDMIQLYL